MILRVDYLPSPECPLESCHCHMLCSHCYWSSSHSSVSYKDQSGVTGSAGSWWLSMHLLCTFTCNTSELLHLNLLEKVNLEISDLCDGRTVYALIFVLRIWVERSLVWHTHRYPFRYNSQDSLYWCEQKGRLNRNLAAQNDSHVLSIFRHSYICHSMLSLWKHFLCQ